MSSNRDEEQRVMRILLVEDAPGDAGLIQEYLREAELQHTLAHVTTLDEAQRRLAAEGADVVLLDLFLPDSTGLDTVTRTLAAAPDAAVVVLTGLVDDRVASEAVARGAQDYLVKDEIDHRLLVRSIRYAVERKGRENERRQVERRERILADAGAIFATSLDYAETLRSVARFIVQEVADRCVMLLVGEADEVRVVEIAPADPDIERLIRRMLARRSEPGVPDPHPIREALRAARVQLIPQISEESLGALAQDEEDLDCLHALRPRSYLSVPVTVRDHKLGVMVLISSSPARRFDEADLLLAKELARRTAQAVENAELYREAREARERTEQLQRVTAALSEALRPSEVAEVLVRESMNALKAVSCSLIALNEAGTEFEILYAEGLGEEVHAKWRRFPVDSPAPVCDAVRARQALFFEAITEFEESIPTSWRRPGASSPALRPWSR
jgi:DNA-binding NarL/FixJ family response regulator